MSANQVRINLLGTQDLDHTPWGRLITWATTYGRYIMITTEIVVLLAFISRFSLDRKNTDLTEELTQKQAILQANAPFEQEIKSLQTTLSTAKSLLTIQPKPIFLLHTIESIVPSDVYIVSLDITNKKLSLSAIANSTQGFAQFLSNLQATKSIEDVLLGGITREPIIGIKFDLSANISQGNKK